MEILLWIAVVLIVGALVVGGAIGALVVTLAHRNRVNPRVASRAPLRWLWSGSLAARLHRRLIAALTAARLAAGLRRRARRAPDLVEALAVEAVALDERVVAAAYAPRRVRRQLLSTLESHVVTLEGVAGRLAGTLAADGRPQAGPPPALEEVAERLDALDAAVAELEAVERLPELPRPTRAQSTS